MSRVDAAWRRAPTFLAALVVLLINAHYAAAWGGGSGSLAQLQPSAPLRSVAGGEALGGVTTEGAAGGVACPIQRVAASGAPAMERFHSWLVLNGANVSSIYFDGRTVRAAKPVAAGAEVFQVPGFLTLSPEMAAHCGAGGQRFMAELMRRMNDAGLRSYGAQGEEHALSAPAVLLLNEMIAGEASVWAPYVNVLPQRHELPATSMMWTDAAYAELSQIGDKGALASCVRLCVGSVPLSVV